LQRWRRRPAGRCLHAGRADDDSRGSASTSSFKKGGNMIEEGNMTALAQPSTTRQRSTPVEVAPDIDWLDRVTGRAAVDPAARARREMAGSPERRPRSHEAAIWGGVAPTALLDLLAVGVVVHEGGVVVYANQTALELLGMPPKRLLGRVPLGRDWRVQREDG